MAKAGRSVYLQIGIFDCEVNNNFIGRILRVSRRESREHWQQQRARGGTHGQWQGLSAVLLILTKIPFQAWFDEVLILVVSVLGSLLGSFFLGHAQTRPWTLLSRGRTLIWRGPDPQIPMVLRDQGLFRASGMLLFCSM